MSPARSPFRLVLRRCLVVAAVPTALLAGLSLLVPRPELADPTTAGAFVAWLQWPLVAASASTALAAVCFWPTIADGRPGAELVQRLLPGRLHGAFAAVLAALTAQLLLTLPIGLWWPIWLGAPPRAEATVDALAVGDLLLRSEERAVVGFELPAEVEVRAVELRALAMLPEGPATPTRVRLVADGGPLLDAAIVVAESHQVLRASFPARSLRRFRLERQDGALPLLFPPGSVQVVLARDHCQRTNGVLLVLLLLLPSWVALGLGVLSGRAAKLPVVATVVGAILFVTTLGDVGPAGKAVQAVLRGHWLPGTEVLRTAWPLLLVGCAAMIVARAVVPKRWR